MQNKKKDFINNLEYIDGITIIDTQGIILFSVKFNSIFKDEVEDNILGKKLEEIFVNLNKNNSLLYKSIETGKPIRRSEQKIVDYRGKDIKTMSISIPIKVNDNIIGAIDISKDISSEKLKLKDEVLLNFESFKNSAIIKKSLILNKPRYCLDDIITQNKEMEKLKVFVKKISDSISPVFIYGETGTGKELFAHSIHSMSNRSNKPFISQNCAAIPENLLESLLFGTTKGSFTGAENNMGLFELASGGTLFLDEINAMPIKLQTKLLRVLEDGYIRRLGDKNEKKIDVRIISASNIELEVCLNNNLLRKDIYFRLCVFEIKIPPLRKRKDDITLLLNYFVNKFNKSLDKKVKKISKEAYEVLLNYNWPGNVREFKHIIEYVMNIIDVDEHIIEFEHLENKMRKEPISTMEQIEIQECGNVTLKKAVAKLEKRLIMKALEGSKGNVTVAAKKLDIPRQSLRRKIDNFKINIEK